ncbi:cytochrome P450 89A2-like [Hordeum vulgare subsp. vulgare]|uniref:Predicted protein n=1 Tax=Hordeum vulgare subsp. vulgare TaxID=112509 RepID=F2D103_HORVV|nr:cytochrome P450 89A2-like [Hordeum vulgare subsp. vulgare]BAJ88774.1 predicted protein [Hordeum vulgare subsp. vulgare]
MYFPLIDARRRRHRRPGETVAHVDTLIDLCVPDDASNAGMQRRLGNAELVGMCSEFLGAGTEAVAAELQWIMAYLVKRPALQEAVRKEIDDAVGTDADEVSEELLEKMDYLNAVILEALRLRPSAPFVFRQVMEGGNVVLDGRHVPAGTVMKFPSGCLVLDETAWADPNEFKPERFLGSSGGERVSLLAAAGSAGEIKMMPFGAGRRMCPGMGVAMLHLTYITANLVREFEWREMGGELAVDLEPSIAFFTLMKRQLRAHLVPRCQDKQMMHASLG